MNRVSNPSTLLAARARPELAARVIGLIVIAAGALATAELPKLRSHHRAGPAN